MAFSQAPTGVWKHHNLLQADDLPLGNGLLVPDQKARIMGWSGVTDAPSLEIEVRPAFQHGRLLTVGLVRNPTSSTVACSFWVKNDPETLRLLRTEPFGRWHEVTIKVRPGARTIVVHDWLPLAQGPGLLGLYLDQRLREQIRYDLPLLALGPPGGGANEVIRLQDALVARGRRDFHLGGRVSHRSLLALWVEMLEGLQLVQIDRRKRASRTTSRWAAEVATSRILLKLVWRKSERRISLVCRSLSPQVTTSVLTGLRERFESLLEDLSYKLAGAPEWILRSMDDLDGIN